MFFDILLTKPIGLIVKNKDRDIIRNILFKKIIIRVYFNLKKIWCKSNISFDNRYCLIFALIHVVNSFFCKILNKDLAIVILDFFIQTPYFWGNL